MAVLRNAPKQDKRVGRKIKQSRSAKGLTQEELAVKLRVSQTWIAMVENGRGRPSLELLYKIAAALDVDLKQLF